jgi:serine/threonine protein phosphatase 1
MVLLRLCSNALIDLENDTLIDLGDVCDGYDEVKECVDLLLKCKNLISMVGNHDNWFDTWMRTGLHPVQWQMGGKGTVESYIRSASTTEMPIHIIPSIGGWVTNLCNVDIPKSHIDFFGKQELYYVDDKNRLFLHAGFDRNLSIRENQANDPSMLFWDRQLWKQALSCVGEQKLKTIDNFSEIFIGHTATTNYKHKPTGQDITTPMNSGGVWNVDTGCGWSSGKLTIMDVDTKKYWQSDIVGELYPGQQTRG